MILLLMLHLLICQNKAEGITEGPHLTALIPHSEEDEAYSPHRHMPHSNQFHDVVGQSIPDTRHYTTSTSATNRGDIPYQSK